MAPDAAPALAPPAAGPALGRFVQLHRRYVVEETPEGLRIVDPHAVHERVLYEQIVARVAREPLESQRFLFPLVVDVDPEQVLALADRREALAQLGFEVDPFGRGALAIHAAPRLLAGERAARALVDLLGEPDACDAEALDAPPGAGRLLHELAATLACRAAVRFGDALPDAQLAALLAERARVPNGHCCPHGRPTALHLSLDELDRRFGRQGAG